MQKGLISKFAVPERIRFVDTLLLTSVDKIDKKRLRETYRDELAVAGSEPVFAS